MKNLSKQVASMQFLLGDRIRVSDGEQVKIVVRDDENGASSLHDAILRSGMKKIGLANSARRNLHYEIVK